MVKKHYRPTYSNLSANRRARIGISTNAMRLYRYLPEVDKKRLHSGYRGYDDYCTGDEYAQARLSLILYRRLRPERFNFIAQKGLIDA